MKVGPPSPVIYGAMGNGRKYHGVLTGGFLGTPIKSGVMGPYL